MDRLSKDDVAEVIRMKEHEVRKLDLVTMQKVIERTVKLYEPKTVHRRGDA